MVSNICQKLAKEFNLPQPLATILNNRGFSTIEEARDFLYPTFEALPTPFLMHGMERAIDLIISECSEKKPLIVHGDYDVDGITATVLLVQFFQHLNIETFYYIPNRLTEQYGLTRNSVDNIIEITEGRKGVLVTVDCGISATKSIAYAQEKGFTVIVTDHHEPPSVLPAADALINPKINGCDFPFKELSGAGVAFFLIAGIRRILIEKKFWSSSEAIPNLKQYLDLVALGTIADVMPLVDVNRVLVRAGLEVINKRQRVGIESLCKVCGMYRADTVTPEDISFKLAPRINAAGRMGKAEVAAELLLKGTYATGTVLSKQLDSFNSERKSMEKKALEEIFFQCTEEREAGAQALIIYNPNCHPGILGILASRVVEKFGCPAIVLTNEKDGIRDKIKGSGRSIKGINIYEKTKCCEHLLKRFGGHPMAIGVSLEYDNLALFKEQFNKECDFDSTENPEDISIDYSIRDKETLSEEFISKLQLFQPFGEGNPEPVFMLENETLKNVKEIREHLKFTIDSLDKNNFSGIGFYLADKGVIAKDGPVDIIFKVKRTSYRGTLRKEIQLIDAKPSC